MIKYKKGQFYIFMAILLIAYAFNIARPTPLAVEKPDIFKELYENFLTEGPLVVNNALYEETNVSERFRVFADKYVAYAVTKQPDFKLAYVLRDKDVVVVGNKLGRSAIVTTGNASFTVNSGSELTLTPEDITLTVAGIDYAFTIDQAEYQLKTLFRQQTSTETRVFVSN